MSVLGNIFHPDGYFAFMYGDETRFETMAIICQVEPSSASVPVTLQAVPPAFFVRSPRLRTRHWDGGSGCWSCPENDPVHPHIQRWFTSASHYSKSQAIPTQQLPIDVDI